jgi:hypothetical protein
MRTQNQIPSTQFDDYILSFNDRFDSYIKLTNIGQGNYKQNATYNLRSPNDKYVLLGEFGEDRNRFFSDDVYIVTTEFKNMKFDSGILYEELIDLITRIETEFPYEVIIRFGIKYKKFRVTIFIVDFLNENHKKRYQYFNKPTLATIHPKINEEIFIKELGICRDRIEEYLNQGEIELIDL